MPENKKDKQKKIVLMGRSKAGKTTLAQYITNQDVSYHKTQAFNVVNGFILDTPGEYLEGTVFRGALTVIAADADIVVFVQDATENGTMFPPSFCSLFCKPVIGLVTKSDIATEKQIENSKAYLRMAGASKIFVISSITGDGVEDFLREIDYMRTEAAVGE